MTNTKKIKISRKLEETTNFDQFSIADEMKILPAPLSGERFEALKHSIKERGQLIPISVDAKMSVLDGRGRLNACKELGIPVRYQHIPEERDSLQTVLDGAQNREWTILERADFIRYVSDHAVEFGIVVERGRLRHAVGVWLQERMGWSFGMSDKNVYNYIALSERFAAEPDESIKDRAIDAATVNEALKILPKPNASLTISQTPLPGDRRLKLLNQIIGEFQVSDDEPIDEKLALAARTVCSLLNKFLESVNVA